ncbi:MAG: arsenosugar biosynthesis radical SAM (seleno)protein ArsS [bacterium]
MQDTRPYLLSSRFPALARDNLTTIQVNLGYLCNQSCTHCHVNAGPNRTELMTGETVDLLIEVLAARQPEILDLTGGAPEMNPAFRRLVVAARSLGIEVIDRCNLTILLESGQEDLAEFLATQRVTLVASMPCYSQENVDQQRGNDVFRRSIHALKMLNALGYGVEENLQLNLVYNPNGAFLPPAQEALEQQYKRRLFEDFGIRFNQLFTITNMPISRFGAVLLAKGEFDSYMELLRSNFQQENLASVMCRNLVSIDWQGNLYDCDFNQMLKLPMLDSRIHNSRETTIASDRRLHLRDLLGGDFSGHPIRVAEHCFGCTAGQGSSCGGAL